MVNAGAIATTSLAPDWRFLHEGLSRFAGRELPFDDAVYASASADERPQPGHRAPARELRARSYRDPAEAVDLYTRQCSLQRERAATSP